MVRDHEKKQLRHTNSALVIVFWTLAPGLMSCAGFQGKTDPVELCRFVFEIETTEGAIGMDVSTLEIAQSILVTSNASPAQVELKLLGVGVPVGDLFLSVEGDQEGKPDGVVIGKSTIDAANVLTTEAAFYAFKFAENPTLITGTPYWLRLRASTPTSENFVQWQGNDTNAYSDGKTLVGSGGEFSSGVIGDKRDMLFKIGCT